MLEDYNTRSNTREGEFYTNRREIVYVTRAS